jgi:hypothetical protein
VYDTGTRVRVHVADSFHDCGPPHQAKAKPGHKHSPTVFVYACASRTAHPPSLPRLRVRLRACACLVCMHQACRVSHGCRAAPFPSPPRLRHQRVDELVGQHEVHHCEERLLIQGFMGFESWLMNPQPFMREGKGKGAASMRYTTATRG